MLGDKPGRTESQVAFEKTDAIMWQFNIFSPLGFLALMFRSHSKTIKISKVGNGSSDKVAELQSLEVQWFDRCPVVSLKKTLDPVLLAPDNRWHFLRNRITTLAELSKVLSQMLVLLT